MLAELNLKVPMARVKDPLFMAELKQAAISALCDGYQLLVYNFEVSDKTLTKEDSCPFQGFPLEELLEENRFLQKKSPGEIK